MSGVAASGMRGRGVDSTGFACRMGAKPGSGKDTLNSRETRDLLASLLER